MPTLKTRTSWREKLEKTKGLPKSVTIPPKMAKRFGQGKMWRVIRDDGSLIEKFPGGTNALSSYLKKEGHAIECADKKKLPKVKDFKKHLIKL